MRPGLISPEDAETVKGKRRLKPRSFKYVQAQSLGDVFDVLDDLGDDAKIIAGGQSLVAAMNMRFAAPEVLVDVGKVLELTGIGVEGDMLRIGAMSRHVEVLNSSDVATHAPLISQAMPNIAHVTIRNRGTFGGSLVNADPASELPACTLALNASFNIQSSAGARSVAAADFFEGTYATCLADNEVLVSVDVPLAGPDSRPFFEEFSRRRGDYAMAGLAATADVSGGQIANASLVFFAVSEMPAKAPAAEALLNGQSASGVDVDAVCAALAVDVAPFEDLTTSAEAKMHLMQVLTRKAIAAWAEENA